VLFISIHAPRAGSDGEAAYNILEQKNFNPRSPCGERLQDIEEVALPGFISIHAPRAGSDMYLSGLDHFIKISIHAPRAGSDFTWGFPLQRARYFNPRSPCGERQEPLLEYTGREVISIHAPRAGSDARPPTGQGISSISIHAPRAGSDFPVQAFNRVRNHFNPRSPCGERPYLHDPAQPYENFNPRSPCGERPVTPSCNGNASAFQSTLPVRGATPCPACGALTPLISIHAPRAGSDNTLSRLL